MPAAAEIARKGLAIIKERANCAFRLKVPGVTDTMNAPTSLTRRIIIKIPIKAKSLFRPRLKNKQKIEPTKRHPETTFDMFWNNSSLINRTKNFSKLYQLFPSPKLSTKLTPQKKGANQNKLAKTPSTKVKNRYPTFIFGLFFRSKELTKT